MNKLLKKFTPWIQWKKRNSKVSVDLSSPGVYLLAHFKDGPPSGGLSLSSDVIYIGETCGQFLSKRLDQFGRSAFGDKRAHSGGSTFWNVRPKVRPANLYVSVLASKKAKNDLVATAYLRYVERALIWEYVRIHRERPKCNKK